MSKKVSWKSIGSMVSNIAKEIKKDTTPYRGIYAIPRGGLVPGVMLSHKLELPMLLFPKDSCIIIDDISDTGKTLSSLHRRGNNLIVTLFYHKQSIVVPDIWCAEKKKSWIIFPWEVL